MASLLFTSHFSLSTWPSPSLARSEFGFFHSRPLRISNIRQPPQSLVAVAMATPSKAEATRDELSKKISSSIKDAEELCKADGTSGECAAAWDEVEELSSTAAHERVKAEAQKDPLEQFCKDQPEADECRVYED